MRIHTKIFMLMGVVCSLPALMVTSANANTEYKGVTVKQLSHRNPIHWVTVSDITKEIKNLPPMNVGFDIDDTVLFSSPAFFHGKQVFSPHSNAYLGNPKFWNAVSNGWDKYSLTKQVAAKLILMHLKHHDHIYFITGRPVPNSGYEDLTNIIRKDYNIPASSMSNVIFSGTKKGAKISYIKNNNIKYFYGDSDSDITAARKAGAVGIRVMRAINSTNRPLPHNGDLGEDVIVNSQY